MEEDTGKLNHAAVDGKEVSLIDFNRSGVPLVEIVTEPDIRSGEEAKIFLTELQKIIRYLGVSDAAMDKGHMRLEPNISLRPVGQKELAKYKVEVKNINSFIFVDKAIQFEEKRHKEMLDKGEIPVQETRGWNEFKNKTVSQRSKEEAHDYRYFPEPDIPPISLTDSQISDLKSQLPELPNEKAERFVKEFGLTDYKAEILTREVGLATYFEEAVKVGKEHNVDGKTLSNWIINKKPNIESELPASLVKIIVEQSPQQVAAYKAGKVQLLGFFIGQTKQALPEAKDTEQIRYLLSKMLE